MAKYDKNQHCFRLTGEIIYRLRQIIVGASLKNMTEAVEYAVNRTYEVDILPILKKTLAKDEKKIWK